MERKIAILEPFFDKPRQKYSVRQLSRMLRINHTTVGQHLKVLDKEGYIALQKEGIYDYYTLNTSRKTLNLKLYNNFERIRKSGLIEDLERTYDFPAIILFGSYSTATDDEKSDVDICLITNVNKKFLPEKYEQTLRRTLSFHMYTGDAWKRARTANPELVNSICNGIVLSGEFSII